MTLSMKESKLRLSSDKISKENLDKCENKEINQADHFKKYDLHYHYIKIINGDFL